MQANRKVFVSGCFDLLHSGHVAFLKTAASFGTLYVGVARDETIALLKNETPANTEAERLFMVRSLRYVKEAWLSAGLGFLDFEADVARLRPDILVVNDDGHSPEKEALCARLGIGYRVLPRVPEPGLPARSSSELRESAENALPYRAELCGAWLDQPFVNRVRPGYVICARLAAHPAFARECGGLATSTRAYLAQLKAAGLSRMEPEALARLVFRSENGIDREGHPVSGAQDALGLCMPGVSFQYYDGGYWPRQVQSITDRTTLRWLEARLSLYPLRARESGFDPLRGQNPHREAASQILAEASALCKSAIETRCPDTLSESFTLCRKAQKALLPAMFPPRALEEIRQLEAGGHIRNWKFSGAGGGGWVILLDAKELEGAIPLRIA
ncbi:MAG: adenylyltransferase/cytidyltransferase family protein [Oscillospiraceae bacterium]|nr:adenylyltransferase/cytidyltransferase family protein [Oscillospiraceae bacterium]